MVERDAIHNSISFSHRKSKNVDITVGQLKDPQHVKKMISDEEMYTIFKKIRGTPQFFKDMQLDVLAKIRYFGVPTFFMTWSCAQFQWTHLIKVVARISKPSQDLSDDEIELMDWKTKVSILKRNPVLVARQIDYIFQSVWNKVVMGGLHPIGQILNFDERGEFQNATGTKHLHNTIHVEDAPKLDPDDSSNDEEVIEYVDGIINTALPDKEKYPDFHALVKKVQTHHHTQTCKKKKGKLCRFDAPWPVTKKNCYYQSKSR
jgi:hypothetical protein